MNGNNNLDSESLLVNSPVVSTKKRNKILIIVTALFVIGLSVFYFFQANQRLAPVTENETSNPRFAVSEDLSPLYALEAIPSLPEGVTSSDYGLTEEALPESKVNGTIVFTGFNQQFATSSNLFLLSIVDGVIKPPYTANFMPKSEIGTFAEFENLDTPGTVYFNTVTNESYESDSVYGLHRIDLVNERIWQVTSANGNTGRDFEWSESVKLLAFDRMKVAHKTIADMAFSNDWEILVIDPKADTLIKVIDGGVKPYWSPDGSKLIYLKDDGLYMYDLVKDVEQKVIGASGERVLTTSNIALSPNGKYLIWTTAKAGLITMYEISSWEKFEPKEIGRILVTDTEVYYPVFSPDSSYYVVQAIDSLKEGDSERKNPRLEIRPTLGRSLVQTYSLQGYKFTALTNDDWISYTPSVGQ